MNIERNMYYTNPSVDHVKVIERYPIPTHTPFTHVCCEVQAGEQGISNENPINLTNFFPIYLFTCCCCCC